MHWVQTTVRLAPQSEETVQRKLPMLDPHELLRWLWETKRVCVSKAAVEQLVAQLLHWARADFLCPACAGYAAEVLLVPFQTTEC